MVDAGGDRPDVPGVGEQRDNTWQVEVFFDGDCPLCVREIRTLGRLDRGRGRIRFTDIAAPEFDAATHGRTQADFMARIRGRTRDGEWLEGVEVFRQLYGAVGFGPLVALTRAPGVRHALDVAYDVFARNRLRLTGRADACADGACAVPTERPAATASPTA